MACGNLQMCAGLEACIEGATHAVGQWIIERLMARRREEADVDGASDEEEEGGGIAESLNNLITDTAGTEEEVAEQLATVLEMEVEETCKGE